MDMSCVGCMIAPLPTFSRLFAIEQKLVLAGIGNKGFNSITSTKRYRTVRYMHAN